MMIQINQLVIVYELLFCTFYIYVLSGRSQKLRVFASQQLGSGLIIDPTPRQT